MPANPNQTGDVETGDVDEERKRAQKSILDNWTPPPVDPSMMGAPGVGSGASPGSTSPAPGSATPLDPSQMGAPGAAGNQGASPGSTSPPPDASKPIDVSQMGAPGVAGNQGASPGDTSPPPDASKPIDIGQMGAPGQGSGSSIAQPMDDGGVFKTTTAKASTGDVAPTADITGPIGSSITDPTGSAYQQALLNQLAPGGQAPLDPSKMGAPGSAGNQGGQGQMLGTAPTGGNAPIDMSQMGAPGVDGNQGARLSSITSAPTGGNAPIDMSLMGAPGPAGNQGGQGANLGTAPAGGNAPIDVSQMGAPGVGNGMPGAGTTTAIASTGDVAPTTTTTGTGTAGTSPAGTTPAGTAPTGTAPATTTSPVDQELQDLIASLSGETTLDSNGVKGAYDAYRVASERARARDQNALAEQYGAQGNGARLGGLQDAVAQLNERTGEGQASYAGNLVKDQMNQRRQGLLQALQIASANGNTKAAQAIQMELAKMQLGYQYTALDKNTTLAQQAQDLQKQLGMMGLKFDYDQLYQNGNLTQQAQQLQAYLAKLGLGFDYTKLQSDANQNALLAGLHG